MGTGVAYKVPIANMTPTAIFRYLVVFNLPTEDIGRIKMMTSCTIADPLLAYAIALIFIHFPLMSRSQKELTG